MLRLQNAALPVVLAGFQGTSPFAAVAKRMRRLLGSCRGAARQDVSVAADAVLPPEDESERAKLRGHG